MPRDLISELVSQLECEQITETEHYIRAGEEINQFYLIKSGGIRLLDNMFNYMYQLNQGSYFGELHILFGLRS